tara:strand:- start:174 stop:788 length:615 start_codon:yes stop_codon:yes gene_type:complete
LPILCLLTDRFAFRDVLKLKKTILDAVDGGVNFLIIRDIDSDPIFIKRFIDDLKNELSVEIPISINVGISSSIPTDTNFIHLPEYSKIKENDSTGIVGRSVHSLKSALCAEARGADYLIVGTIYPSHSHPDKLPEGLSLIKSITSKVSIPVFGIGGITSDNILPVLESGASGVSVISSILYSEDPRQSAKKMYSVLKENYIERA